VASPLIVCCNLSNMTDWNSIARFRNPELASNAISDIAAGLDALEAAFRPLLKQLTTNVEPAVILSESAVLGE
jgi:hypothetical protein